MPDEGLGRAKIPISPDLEGLDQELNKARSKIEGKLNRVFSKLGGTLAKAGKAAVVGGIKAVAAGAAVVTAALATTIGPASDLNETISKVGVVFGDQAPEVLAFGKNAAKALGMSQEAALAAAGTYGNLFRSMGMAEDQSADMSTGLVTLASDLASFNNMDPTLVLDKLRAGLTGETEPLKSLGVNLNQAMIEAKAMEMGLIGLDGELTAAAKAQATYALVMDQTALAQGDFARTSDGLANQQRILSATMTDLRATIGTAVLPIITALVGGFTELMQSEKAQQVIQTITETLTRLGEKASTVIALFMEGDLAGGMAALFGQETVDKITEIATNIGAFVEKLGGLDVVLNTVAVVVGGVLVVAFYAWATAAWAAAAPMIPLYALVAAIIAVVALAALAWQNDWGGIRTFIIDLWNNTLKPIFDTLVQWLQTNIPVALAALSGFWTGTLLPAIQAVATWVTGTLVPVLQTIWEWLATNVPLALQTLSDFWTNTLLPAITAVGEFIQNSLVPLFMAVVDVYIAALNLALTALAGLWQNVLLPAITTVANFISETVIPALTNAWSWLSEKLSPAIKTVVEWFDKFVSSGGGLETILKLVTDKVRDLAAKLGVLKLPDWLTPGSPTPMENGLRGIGAALGPVIDRLMDFARSISGPQAKAMKDMASAFKDMAKGIDELAGSMNKLSVLAPVGSSGSGGGASAFGGWLEQFETVYSQAAVRIDAIINEVGYNKIKKLRLTARRLAEIIESIQVDLSGIVARELPDLDLWFGQLYDVFRRAMIVLNAIRDKFGNRAVEMAAELAGYVGTVLQLLGVDLAAIIPPPPNFELLLGLFLAALALAAAAILPWLTDLRAVFSGPLLEGAQKTAESLMAVIGVLTLATVLADLGKDENQLGSNLQALVQSVMDGLSGALDILVPGLEEIQDRWGDALEKVAVITDLMQRVFSNVKDAQLAAVEFIGADEIDMGGLMRKIGTLSAATGAAVAGLTTPAMAGANAGGAGGGGVIINLYMDGQLMQTFTEQINEAGQVDIRLAEAMAQT